MKLDENLMSNLEWLAADPRRWQEFIEGVDGAADFVADAPWYGGIARPDQTPPDGDWFIWALIAGRGAGKTRAGSEWVLHKAKTAENPETFRCALVAPTIRDARNIMVEGDSGLLGVIPPSLLVNGSVADSYRRSLGELRLSTGAYFETHAAESADRLRGTQWHAAWMDEPASYKDAPLGLQDAGLSAKGTAVSNLLLGARLGRAPQIMITGTPRPVALIRQLLDPATQAKLDLDVRVTRASTYANARNLAPQFMRQVVGLYADTRLGRQELYGELIDLGSGFFDTTRLIPIDSAPTNRVWRARAWDLAATEPSPENQDPDWTVGTLASVDERTRTWTIEDIARVRLRPGDRDDFIADTAIADKAAHGSNIRYFVEQEPGSGGKSQVAALQGLLDGIVPVAGHRTSGKKHERALIPAAAVEQGRVRFVGGQPWMEAFLNEMAEFNEEGGHAHDDIVDTISTLFEVGPSGAGRRRRTFDGMSMVEDGRKERNSPYSPGLHALT